METVGDWQKKRKETHELSDCKSWKETLKDIFANMYKPGTNLVLLW